MIFSQKDIALVLLYGAILSVSSEMGPSASPSNWTEPTFDVYRYSLTFAVIVTLASDLKDAYGLTTLQDGLCYMAYGFGAVLSSIISRTLLDRDFAKVAEKALKEIGLDSEHAVSCWRLYFRLRVSSILTSSILHRYRETEVRSVTSPTFL
jgi:hypothetical protein